MTSIDDLVAQISGLRRQDLEFWIFNEWVRPDEHAGRYVFGEIDVARVRLIQELRDRMEVNDASLPVVLSLLDQLYDMRRRMRELSEALNQTATDDVRRDLALRLARRSPVSDALY